MASTSEASSSRRRILDYINDGEELGAEEPAVTPRTPAPAAAAAARTRMPRFGWARMATRLVRKGGCGKGKEEVVVEKDDERPAAVVSSSVCEEADSERRPSDHGVGLSLVFLLAKTSDEFNKMVKVRGEMETLLKEIKDQVWQSSGGGHGDASKTCNNNLDSAASSCVTDRNENERGGIAHLVAEDQATSSGSCEKSSESACIARMDVLEEEFHAELELLHVNYGSDALPPFLPEEHDTEQLGEISDYREGFNDDSGGAEVVEEEDDDGDDDSEYYGVSAVKLERRLHELLHERNQARIEELESALRRAEKKLVEKEMEVCLWKDTAKLALRQDNKL